MLNNKLPSKILILISVFFFSFLTGVSQPKKALIKGTVIDTQSGQPLEYATIIIRSVNDHNAITGGITDVHGQFNVEVSPGEYNVSLEFITYKSFTPPQSRDSMRLQI